MKDDQTEADRARALAAEAAEVWIRRHPGWEDAIITGYVLVLEAVPPIGVPTLQWMTGNGAEPRDGNREPQPQWRARGMLSEVISELDGRNAEHARREMEDE